MELQGIKMGVLGDSITEGVGVVDENSADDKQDKSITLKDSYGPDIWNVGYEDSFGVLHEPISAYPEDEGAFDMICKLGSTKNIICGHNHVNNWVVKYKGVRFIFGTKTGSGSYWEPEINGGTVV